MTSHTAALTSIERRRAIGEHPVHGIWIITDRDGARLGNLLLKPIPLSAGEEPSDPAEVEIGWHLRPDARGHGYATEAADAAATDTFARGQSRIIAVTHLDNQASQAVCRRIGMHLCICASVPSVGTGQPPVQAAAACISRIHRDAGGRVSP